MSARGSDEGLKPQVAIFDRSDAQIPRAEAAAKHVGAPYVILDENIETKHNHLSITTMHLAKGLEFRAVAVIACDDEVLPLQERIESVMDESDLDDVYATERHLLYGVYEGEGLVDGYRSSAGFGVHSGSASGHVAIIGAVEVFNGLDSMHRLRARRLNRGDPVSKLRTPDSKT